MKNLKDIILEKILINDKFKSFTKLDTSDEKMMMDLLKAMFIGLYKQHFICKPDIFSMTSLSNFKIKRTFIDYQNIIDIANSYYNYNFDINDVVNKKSQLYNILHTFIDPLEKLINMKSNVNVNGISKPINGSDLYWTDWKKYCKNTQLHA